MHNEATINNEQPSNDYQCHHIFPDDHRCGSPRLRNEQFCYYHHDSRRPVVRPHERLARRSTFSLFTPTDFDAIQESLGELLVRIAAKDIDPRRAGLLLYCLQIASTNLRSTRKEEPSTHAAQPTPTETQTDSSAKLPSSILGNEVALTAVPEIEQAGLTSRVHFA
jgi:hypothetical protein